MNRVVGVGTTPVAVFGADHAAMTSRVPAAIHLVEVIIGFVNIVAKVIRHDSLP